MDAGIRVPKSSSDLEARRKRMRDSRQEMRVQRDGLQAAGCDADLCVQVRCENCPHKKIAETVVMQSVWSPQPAWDDKLRFIRNHDLANDTMELIPQLPSDIIGVIGIPVSGMIPAAYLSRMLCVPLYSLDYSEGILSVGDGKRNRNVSRSDGRYLVVDDTVYGGGEMQRAQNAIKRTDLQCVFAAVYCRKPEAVDIFSVYAPGSVVLEWNIFNSASLAGNTVMSECKGGFASDFDGVICEEPPVNDVRDFARFEWWLANARPQYIPRKHEIPLVISFRIEPWRQVTKQWMHRWGVRAKQLVLHPAKTIRDRERDRNRVVTLKGSVFRDSQCGVMFESDVQQARVIADVSGKTVIVPTTGEVFTGDAIKAKLSSKRYHKIEKKNLIYHVYADRANDGWLMNVKQIVNRMDVFNGKRLVAVAESPACHSFGEVEEAFFGCDVEFIRIPNNPTLREAGTFLPLLKEVANTRDSEATFYAHTKGNTTPEGVGAVRWRNAMYHHLLDRVDEVMDKLRSFKAVGTTQMIGPFRYPSGLNLTSKDFWMFAGTFFWFRHDGVFAEPNWSRFRLDRYSAEAWLGQLIHHSDVFSIFQPWTPCRFPQNGPYDIRYYSEEFEDHA